MSNPKRVNIQFSIELEELPSEISRLIQKSQSHLNEGTKVYNNLGNTTNVLTTETWDDIDNIRISLSKADQVLDDLQSIISGYLKMKTDAVQPQSTQTESPTSAATESPFMSSHPDAGDNTSKSPFSSGGPPSMEGAPDLQQMQSQMMQMMSNMQNNMDNSEDLSEEEQQAAEVLRKRISKVMTNNADSPENSG